MTQERLDEDLTEIRAVSEDVAKAIESLERAPSAEAIAGVLRAAKVRGYRKIEGCPLARYLAAIDSKLRFAVTEETIRAWMDVLSPDEDATAEYSFRDSSPCADFIAQFDAGRFPDLDVSQ